MNQKLLCGLIAGVCIWVLGNIWVMKDMPLKETLITQIIVAHQKPTQEQGGADLKKNYAQIGAQLMKNEKIGSLTVGISDDELVSVLGQPVKKSAPKVWPADGREYQVWYYPSQGIEINMMRKKEVQVINAVLITEPCHLKTKRGIGIGSTAEEVEMAYKNEINPQFSKENSSLIAGTVYGGIIFDLKDGLVSSVFSGAAE